MKLLAVLFLAFLLFVSTVFGQLSIDGDEVISKL
jgi:hypothetical protein